MLSNLVTAATGATHLPVELLSSLGIDHNVWPKQTNLQNLSTHDYIIVGLGTAGSVVARRLAEDHNNSVLALEAGENPLIIALIAGLFSLLPHTSIDYDYKSVFDSYAASSQNNYTMLTAGKTIGGSATINHFLHTRGSRLDFDNWAKILEDDLWKLEFSTIQNKVKA